MIYSVLLIIAIYTSNVASMELYAQQQQNLATTSAKFPLLSPCYYKVHNNDDFGTKKSSPSEDYFLIPKLFNNLHLINNHLYTANFEYVLSNNLAIAKSKNIPQEVICCYKDKLKAELFCINYDLGIARYNYLHLVNGQNPLIPSFGLAHNDSDIEKFFDVKNQFYTYPKPVNPSIKTPLYRKTALKTLKINIIIAYEMGLKKDTIKSYIIRMLAQIICDSYDLKILQQTCQNKKCVLTK